MEAIPRPAPDHPPRPCTAYFAPARPGTTIVVPALDEAEGIVLTLEGLDEVARGIEGPVEILVVDDGSRDGTGELARERGARVIRHPEPAGYGAALKTGIRAARHETIVIIDADGTYPIAAIPTLLELLRDVDMVVGARTGRHYRRRSLLSPLRALFLLLASFVIGKRIPDPNSGLRAFRRETALPLLDALPRKFSFTTTITLVMSLQGRFVHYHPIVYQPRVGKRKVRPLRDARQAAQTMVEVILRYNPLKLYLLLGGFPAILAVVVWAATRFSGAGLVAGAVLLGAALIVFAIGMTTVARLPRRLSGPLGQPLARLLGPDGRPRPELEPGSERAEAPESEEESGSPRGPRPSVG